MNLDFEKDNYRFNARVSAIIYNKDKTKVLLFKIDDGRDFYMLPGGRIELNEDSKTAIYREIKEELNYDLEYNLCSIQENFVYKDGINIMQYCFYYKAIYNGYISTTEFKCLDNDSQIFSWVNIKDIDKLKIVPLSSKFLIQNDNNSIHHIVERKCKND